MRIQTLLQMPARLVVPEEVTQDLEEQHQICEELGGTMKVGIGAQHHPPSRAVRYPGGWTVDLATRLVPTGGMRRSVHV